MSIRHHRSRLFTIPMLAVVFTGCATTGGGLASSAERLERSSMAFQSEARADRESGNYQRDARDLAAEARDFRNTLSDRRADDRDVAAAFEDLSRRYHALRDEVERSNSRDEEREFRPVTEAYLDVERAMHSSARHHDRLARD